MATELEGKPLKFTAIFDSKEAQTGLDDFLRKVKAANSQVEGGVSKSSTKPISQYKSILEGATRSFDDFVKSNDRLYSAIAQSEMGLQKVRNEQNILNKELRQGVLSEQEYIDKTTELNKVREKLSNQLKDNKAQLQKYNAEAKSSKPAFTKEDTLSELAGAFKPGTGASTLSANDAFAKSMQDSINKLNGELVELDKKLKQGAVTNEEYAKSTQTINEKLKSLFENQEHFRQNAGKSAAPSEELSKQKSVLESVSAEYRAMLSESAGAFDAMSPRAKELTDSLVSLREESKLLDGAQRELGNVYREGKVSQDQYLQANRDLIVQQSGVKERIAETRKELNQIDASERKTIGSIAEKTAKLTQLKQKYDQLSESQRNNINIGGKIREEYQQISAEVGKLNSSLNGTKSGGIGAMFSSVRGIAGALGIAFGAQQLVSFGKEIFELTKKIEGVSLAFARIGEGEAGLDKLRKATRNTVDDLQLMTVAVKANDFKIPMDTLAKGLEFAQRKAQDTGKSVDYLVNSFVDGIGRKSTLVLDNLGISVVQIQREVQKVGDFNTAVANIIEREMKRSGDAVDTLSVKTGKLATMWQNVKIAVASFISDAFGDLNTKNVDKYVEESKKGLVGFEKASSATRDVIIANREAYIDAIEKQIKDNEELRREIVKPTPGGQRTTKGINQLLKEEKSLKEQLYAEKSVLATIREQNEALATQERIQKGIVNDTELEAQIAKKRQDAKDWVIEDGSDIAYKNKLIKEADKLQEELDKRSGKGNVARERKAQSELARQLERDKERRVALLDKLASADAEYLRKTLDRDQQEVESVRAKYADLRKEYEKHNKETKGEKLDVSFVNKGEAVALSAVKERQGLDKKLKEYQEDYNNFVKYEQLKNDAGVKYADDQLGKYKDVVVKIKAEYASLATRQGMSKGGLSPAEEAYFKELGDRIKAEGEREVEDRRKSFIEAIKLSENFGTQELEIRKKYQDAFEALEKGKSGITDAEFEARKQALNEGLREEVGSVAIAEMQKRVEWDKTFSYMQSMSHKATEKFLDDSQKRLDAMLAEGKISREQYDQLSFDISGARSQNNTEKGWVASGKALNTYREAVEKFGKDSLEAGKAQKGMFSALGSDLANASMLVGDLGDSFATLGIGGEGLQETVGKISGALGNMGELAGAIASKNPIAIVSASIKTITSVIDIFNTKDKKLQKQIDRYKEQLEALEKSYNKLQRSISNAVGESFYTDSNKAIKNLQEQQRKLAQMAKSEQDKKKTDKNKVAELRKEIESIDEQIEDVHRSITENLVQTSFRALSDELADALVSAFEAGESAIGAMDGTFDRFIKNALANSLKLKMLDPIINKMIEDVADYMKSNDNSLIGFDFESVRDKLGKVSEDFTKALDEAYKGLGLETDKQKTKQGELSKGIAGITEPQANRLEAEFSGVRLGVLELVQVSKSNHVDYLRISSDKIGHLVAISNNTLRTANNTEHLSRLEGIETAMVQMNSKITSYDSAMRAGGFGGR